MTGAFDGSKVASIGPLLVVRIIRISCMEAVSVAECADIVKPRNKQRSILFIRWKLYRSGKKRKWEIIKTRVTSPDG